MVQKRQRCVSLSSGIIRPMQKLYCYVDETGQDAASNIFVVVAVVSQQDQEQLCQALTEIEHLVGIGRVKWHKLLSARHLRNLTLVFGRNLGREELFFGSYPKPPPNFFPLLDVLERAIKTKAVPPHTARVFVDGIDCKKAAELTNALRLRGVSLELLRSRRDESEPLNRLADRWAGCIRRAISGHREEMGAFRTCSGDKLHQTHITKKPLETRGYRLGYSPVARGSISAIRAGLRRDAFKISHRKRKSRACAAYAQPGRNATKEFMPRLAGKSVVKSNHASGCVAAGLSCLWTVEGDSCLDALPCLPDAAMAWWNNWPAIFRVIIQTFGDTRELAFSV
jgi:hypothetical protein